MNEKMKEEIVASIQEFKLPRYREIPDVGLYLEQVAIYISDSLAPLGNVAFTRSMISNYVKKGIIGSPVKKQYSREQIAYLFFVAVSKTVLSMEDIRLLFEMKETMYDSSTAYDYFCEEFENVLRYVFGIKESLDIVGVEDTEEKGRLRNTIITVAHKIYLDKCFARIKEA